MELVNRIKPKEWTKDDDLVFLKNTFELVDTSMVGELLGQGYEYRVYDYGDGQVLKVPKHNHMYGNDIDDVSFNYLIGREYFSDFLIPTDVITKGEDFVIIQKKLDSFRSFNKEDLDNPVLRTKFEDLLTRNKGLVEAGVGTIDLWGFGGVKDTVLKSYQLRKSKVVLDNVVVIEDEDGNEDIVLPDFDLINSGHKPQDLKDSLVSSFSFLMQRQMTKEFLGYDIGKLIKR